MTPRLILPLILCGLVAACDAGGVNPPTEPADPVTGPEAQVPPTAPDRRPGAGPVSFVGLWAAQPAWCAAPQGDRRPINITPTRFEGYENSCAIASVREGAAGWDAVLACESEGQARRERVNMTVAADILTLTYVDRDGVSVKLGRCPAPTPPPAP